MNDLKSLIAKGKPFLRQYLLDQGVDLVRKGTNEWMCCISPDHDDTHPSCAFVPDSDDTYVHCFSCSYSADIFGAAAALEGKPSSGVGFIKENLEYILKKYSVDFEPVEFTDEQLSNFRYDSVYESVYKLMTCLDKDSHDFVHNDISHAVKRGWNRDICKKLGVGSIRDYSKFIDALSKNTRITIEELKTMGIRDDLFGPDFITFCIREHTGMVKGVVARYTKWEEGSKIPKYKNTAIDDNPFYHKDKLLYCLELAKKYTSQRLDIFEGYGSGVTAHQEGYHNCVALGGTALTDNHVDIIRALGFQHVNLVLDQDSVGAANMEKYIEKFSGYNGLKVTTMDLALSDEDKKVKGQNDPDFFIRKYGVSEYRKLKPVGVFEHLIKKNAPLLDQTQNPTFTNDFAKTIIKIIISEPDMLERSQMISTLSKHTNIDKDDIKAEIHRLENNDVKRIRDDLVKNISRTSSIDDLSIALGKTLHTIETSASTKKDKHLVSVGETIEFFDDVFTEMNAYREGIHGWLTGYHALDSMVDGIPKPTKAGRAIAFAGSSQHGKSAIMLNLALNMALNNKDIAICYWAIDDNRKSILYRLVSMISKVPMKRVLNQIKRTPDDIKAMSAAQDLIRELTNNRKLLFKDDKYGRTINRAEDWIKDTQDSTGNPILFCIDSLNNVKNESNSDTRIKLLTSSTWAKGLCARIPCTVMMTLELVKNRIAGQKPNLISVAESGKMEFDMDTIGIVWNEPVGSFVSINDPLIKARWGAPGFYKPIIELDIQKNKSGSGERGSVYFKYDNETTGIVGCSSTLDTNPQPLKDLKGPGELTYDMSSDNDTETGW